MSKARPTASRKNAAKHAAADRRKGKSAGVQAGEYVREQMHKLKAETGATRKPRSRAQAVAIGLNEAREDGIRVPRRKSSAKKRSSTSSRSPRSRSR